MYEREREYVSLAKRSDMREREKERKNVCLVKCGDNPPKLSTICCKE